VSMTSDLCIYGDERVSKASERFQKRSCLVGWWDIFSAKLERGSRLNE
jgi:hypothetical protein